MFNVEGRTKPILKWAGGKSHLLPQLIARFPAQFDRYIEPFMGSGACFFALAEDVPAVLNDANEELIALYRVVRDTPQRLMRTLDSFSKNYCETFYYELRATKMNSKIERAARTIFLNKTGFNGLYRQNSKGGFNVPFGKRDKCPTLYVTEHLLRASKKLKYAELLNEDFGDVLGEARKGDFIYCDPPYEPISATSSFNKYRGTGFDSKEQQRLKKAAALAARRGASVHISNSHCPLILDLYDSFEITTVKARRAINSNGKRRGLIKEVLISL